MEYYSKLTLIISLKNCRGDNLLNNSKIIKAIHACLVQKAYPSAPRHYPDLTNRHMKAVKHCTSVLIFCQIISQRHFFARNILWKCYSVGRRMTTRQYKNVDACVVSCWIYCQKQVSYTFFKAHLFTIYRWLLRENYMKIIGRLSSSW